MVTQSPSLIVYEASAGSGKTFTLAAEYISLLVRNPQAYRQILAVTFTNKATEEMKTRILSQLFGIWRGLENSDDYRDFVCKRLGVDGAYVQHQAGIALHNLMHNYSYFRVETIDSFFQSVLRNLARELDLTATLRIGLNDSQVEEMAVDRLIDSLSASDKILQWLMHYIIDTINDDRSWNVIGQIKQFGKNIFRDFYKEESRRLHQVIRQEGFFRHYTTMLNDLKRQAEEKMKAIGDAFISEMHRAGLDDSDFAYGRSGVVGLFYKLQSGVFDPSVLGSRVMGCVGHPEKWCSNSHPRCSEIRQLVEDRFEPLLQQAVSELPAQWRLYGSSNLTLRHLSQLRLLEHIEKKVHEQNEATNSFLLSDTQQLLHELIDGSDSPFIFEKIGTQLEHIMIDEFQDTSTVQWKNFKVLLNEIMSHNDSKSLIVGDVKQSIYRWRSGDWRLLAGIEGEFRSGMVERVPLDFNYRSCRNIVDFNNAFFVKAAEIEGVSAYKGVKQQVPSKKPAEGFVQIRLLPADDYQQQTLELLCEQVSSLIQQGVQQEEIAILLRTNSFIPVIANYFMEHLPDVQIVSDEAFRLDASVAVNTIIQAFRYLTNPDDKIALAFLSKIWSDTPLHQGSVKEKLPKAFTDNADMLFRMPLHELAEHIYALFRIEQFKDQSAYLCAFYDYIASFAADQQGDLYAFLKEWDETLCSKTIQSPENHGIRLISIHKSKGLEFPTVIIPFCDWQMEHSDILWCKPDAAPYDMLPIVPVDYSARQMTGTIYDEAYKEEHLQNIVDNLNLLYVAFTRASRNLIVYGRRNTKSSRSAIVEQVLPQLKIDGAELQGTADKKSALCFSFGQLTREAHASDDQESQPNVFLAKPESVRLDIRSFKQKAVFRQSNKSQAFAAADDEDDAQQQRYIQTGNILHHVFSTIRTHHDIEAALSQLEGEGIIYDNEVTRDRLMQMIRKRLTDERVAAWFADTPGRRLFNECTIISYDPESGSTSERRPDRVINDGEKWTVVDFKFGKPCDKHHEQVREYMQLLRDMGHAHVEGFLWYVFPNRIEKVFTDSADIKA